MERPTVNVKRWAQGTFRPTPDQKGLFGLLLTKKVFSAQVRTSSAKARPKSPFRPRGGRKHPFRPTRGRRGASFDFSPLHAIVSEFAIKYVIVLKKSQGEAPMLHATHNLWRWRVLCGPNIISTEDNRRFAMPFSDCRINYIFGNIIVEFVDNNLNSWKKINFEKGFFTIVW